MRSLAQRVLTRWISIMMCFNVDDLINVTLRM